MFSTNKYMQKSKRIQIENMLELLNRAHDSVKRALETKNNDVALELLEQCQDSAIQIGGMIEESIGENFITVEFLENYCELLYKAYESIRQKQLVNSNKIYKNLRKELIRIENSVKNDIQVRLKAVFLPYKASMWDSLESVWKMADEDPNCDAYVVPIPYFDKKPDGSFGEMHYEGSQYPSYVPITSWEEFDIAAEHPDMIFIHNPYDEFNYVTSVHPAYYSKELKNQTDCLVYIPYYILEEVDPNNKDAVENIEHFCTVPAVVYADKVIVQSKGWRRIYIDVMTKTMGADTRHVWEKKILGLGSPKLDKVYTTGRSDLDIPEEWLKIIVNPDGSWKKIIFYNTSVSALLQHGEKMLEKMQYVFDFFKENKDEVVLLWRPHPLIKATIESMRPQLWMEYDKAVKAYIEEGWGIYDDTADINRAIAVSDVYYGDRSSVVKMYEETGKPVILQDVEVLSSEKTESNETEIEFYNSVVYDNELWFVSNRKEFMKMNVTTGETAYVDWKDSEKGKKFAVTADMLVYRMSIFWVDNCQRYLHEYDSNNSVYQCYPFPDINGYDLSSDNLAGIYLYEDVLWLFLRDTPYVFEFALRQKSWKVHSEICREWAERETSKRFWRGSVQITNVVCLLEKDNILGKFNLNFGQYERVKIPDSIDEPQQIVWKNDVLYILSCTGKVYKWSEKEGNIEIIYSSINTEVAFGCMVVLETKVFLAPRQTEKILIVDLEKGNRVYPAECPEDLQYDDCLYGKYGSFTEDPKYIWFDNRGGNYIVRINKKKESIEWLKPKLPTIQDEWRYRKKRYSEFVMYEKTNRLERLMHMKRQEEQSKNAFRNVGAIIWRSLMGEI